MRNVTKSLSTAIFSFLFLIIFSCTAFAETAYDSTTVGKIAETTRNSNDIEMSVGAENYGLESATIDQASSWVDKKGFEVVGFLQKIVQPFAIIVFIICTFMILFGNVKSGAIGAGISIVVYVVVLYAPELMAFFLNWVRN